jgi:hypothetical protein
MREGLGAGMREWNRIEKKKDAQRRPGASQDLVTQ